MGGDRCQAISQQRNARLRRSTLLEYSYTGNTKEQLVLIQRRACHNPTGAGKLMLGHKYKGQVGGFDSAEHGRLGVIPNASDSGIRRCQEQSYKLFEDFTVTARLFAKIGVSYCPRPYVYWPSSFCCLSPTRAILYHKRLTGSAMNNLDLPFACVLDLLRVRFCHDIHTCFSHTSSVTLVVATRLDSSWTSSRRLDRPSRVSHISI